MTRPEQLLDQWSALATRVLAESPAADIRAAGAALLDRYAEPHRRYHNTAHLAEVLGRIDELCGFASFPDLVRLAAWFHDAVYEPAGADNEERSAALAEQILDELGVRKQLYLEVSRLVLVTRTHQPAAADRNGQVLCDADLAVLARPEPGYDDYAAAVRAEYAHVPEPEFRAGRARILRALLDRPAIYATSPARAGWETPARANLQRELADLTAGR
ncbi:MAG: metal-dependent phosphohydrolase [Sporichthyaceae bacterium]|nr:metal-dependent phosphohydrolase [Sporichthyaceae bacterium]